MKSKNVTIREIAKITGVSVASVSRTLNGLSGVGEETRKKILETCDQLGYVPNTLARGLVLQKTQTIGVIMPDIASPFYSHLMILAGLEAKKYGYQVLLCNSFRNYEMEINYFNLLIGNQVEGILFFPVGEESHRNVKQFLRYVPIVSLNEMPVESKIPWVAADEVLSGRMATEHLIQCGCQKLAYIGYTEEGVAYRHRVDGFRAVIKENQIYGEVFESSTKPRGGFDQGYRKFCEFWEQKTFIPDGIVASSDETACGILKACKEKGVSVPEDLLLIGFDNIQAPLPMMKLTSVAISHWKHVKKAMDFLFRLKEVRTMSVDERHVLMQPRLFENESCKRIVK